MRTAETERDALRSELASLQERLERTKTGADRKLQALQRELTFLREHIQAFEAGALQPEQHIFRAARLEGGWEPPRDIPLGEVVTKRQKGKPFGTGLTREQLFWLEVNCLIRLNRVERDREEKHFPVLLDIDPAAMSFTMTPTGRSLAKLREGDETIEVRDLPAQAARITAALERAGVIHLDLWASQLGKNLTVNDRGVISLIDFDYAVLDGVPWSGRMKELLEIFAQRGGYRYFVRQILAEVRSCPRIRVAPLIG